MFSGSTYSNAIWKEIEDKVKAGEPVSFPDVLQYAEPHTRPIRNQNYTAKFETRWRKEDSLVVIPPGGA